MKTIRRKKYDFYPLEFEVDLSSSDKTLTDIEDITFLVKVDENETEGIFEKKKSLGEISATGTNILIVFVQWPTDEYDAFTIGQTYLAGLFLKFNGDPMHSEYTDDLFKLIIEQDFIDE